MAYLVLARKHRPQSFEEIIGQESAATTLKNAIASKRISHAYLFFGPRGVGKTTAARVLAKALNCRKGPTPNPCGQCPACAEVAQGRCLDVMEMDAASNTSVENVREAIIETVALAPSRDRFKIFIIDEAHMLSASAFNALLKTMEEPPGHVVFILATTEPHKIPATIFSRCQRFRFKPLPRAAIVERLGSVSKAEKVHAEPEALELLAGAAGGSLRDGLSLMDQAIAFSGGRLTAQSVRNLLGLLPQELVREILESVFQRQPKLLWSRLEGAAQEGYEPVQILKDVREALEAAYLDRLGVLQSQEGWLRGFASGRSAEGLGLLLKRVQRCLEEMRSTDSPRLTLELGLFGLLDAHDLGAWTGRLEALEARLSGAAAQPPGPARQAEKPAGAPPPSPALGSDLASAWERALQRIQGEDPALFGYLHQARVERAGGGLTLHFQTAFHRDGAQRADARLREVLRSLAGGAFELSYALDDLPPPAVTDAAWEEEQAHAGEAPPQGEWKDLTGDPLSEDPGVKKVLQFFPGRLKRPKKEE